ncbi:hypothetical protein [Klebsiella quasipneumoniae]|uniref:hypothetical protein n=1 Tax=Klebsiella quasipneumoniae TaxID=1463165 RepID=UPI00190E0CBF|nr:hypothetical protein [Klebsiella quasipneumoniae]MBK2828929.1 hypothetical protein [Klebsiella quasipneumoniae]
MSKKERNTITRLERENVNRIKSSRLYIKSLEEISGELIEHVEEVHSTPPSVEEWAALNDLLESSSGVYYKPRKRKVYSWDDSNLKKWQILGFTSLCHYLNFNAMNNTVAGVRELDGLFLTENDNYD